MQTNRFQHIFHPFYNADQSAQPFAHALKLATVARAELSIMRIADQEGHEDWSAFPRVRDTLARWKVLPVGAAAEDVEKAGPRVKKISGSPSDPLAAMVNYLGSHKADLIVLSTHGYDGVERLVHKSVAEPLARQTAIPTIFFTDKSKEFISSESGAVHLSRVLVPVCNVPHPDAAVAVTVDLLHTLGVEQAEVCFLNIGEGSDAPEIDFPEKGGWNAQLLARSGPVVETILSFAEQWRPSLLVMATKGHQGFLDALRGSTTERVLRGAPCPTLAVPAFE